jgi:hypothetical protein
MSTWQQFAADAPHLAEPVRTRFEAAPNHVLASLRRDGSPRVSGTEVLWNGPDLLIGSMPGAVKAQDLRRDPRFALHAHPAGEDLGGGDAKLAGRAVELRGEQHRAAVEQLSEELRNAWVFRLDLAEAVLTEISDDRRLIIKRWRPTDGVTAFKRDG